jgi:NAD(P)H dehydrogenase (quinone)
MARTWVSTITSDAAGWRRGAARVVVGLMLAGGAVAVAAASQATAPEPVRVLVAYASVTGNTEQMARAVAEGVRAVPGATVVIKKVADVTDADLKSADAIIVGTPVHNAGMAAEVKSFIDRWPFEQLADKVGAAFVTGGGISSGEELAQFQILSAMLIFRFVIVGGDSALAPFGASAVVEEGKPAAAHGVDAAALAKARALGARVARIAGRLRT